MPARSHRLVLAMIFASLVGAGCIQAEAPAALPADIAGEYRIQGDRLVVDGQGHATLAGIRARGDLAHPYQAEGRVHAEGADLVLDLDADAFDIPPSLRLHPVRADGHLWLMTDDQLRELVNLANLTGRAPTADVCSAHRAARGAPACGQPVDITHALPPEHQARLRQSPLTARVTHALRPRRAPDKTSEDTSTSARAVPPSWYVSLEIDRGRADGVFPGMAWYVTHRAGGTVFEVVSAGMHHARICRRMTEADRPRPGDLASSQAPAAQGSVFVSPCHPLEA